MFFKCYILKYIYLLNKNLAGLHHHSNISHTAILWCIPLQSQFDAAKLILVSIYHLYKSQNTIVGRPRMSHILVHNYEQELSRIFSYTGLTWVRYFLLSHQKKKSLVSGIFDKSTGYNILLKNFLCISKFPKPIMAQTLS